MTLHVAIHQPVTVRAQVFDNRGEDVGCLHFIDKDGASLEVFTTPERAKAMATAFDAEESA